jgi:carbonic anhydrase
MVLGPYISNIMEKLKTKQTKQPKYGDWKSQYKRVYDDKNEPTNVEMIQQLSDDYRNSDINIHDTYGKICDEDTCAFTYKSSKTKDIVFTNNGITLNGVSNNTPTLIHPDVVLNKKYYNLKDINFIISRTVNNYNGSEKSGEIIISLHDINNKLNELYISIPIVKYDNITMINNNVNDSYRTKELNKFYSRIADYIPVMSNETYIIKSFDISKFLPKNAPYYYRTEISDDDFNKRSFISYDVKHAIKISSNSYDEYLLYSRKMEKNGSNSGYIIDVNNYLSPLKNKFMAISELYFNPKQIIESFVDNKINDIFVDCKPILPDNFKEGDDELDIYVDDKKGIEDEDKSIISTNILFYFILIICIIISLSIILGTFKYIKTKIKIFN